MTLGTSEAGTVVAIVERRRTNRGKVVNNATAVIAVVGALLLMWKFGRGKWITKMIMLLAMFAAANLSGGWFGQTSHSAADTLQNTTTNMTEYVFGVAVPSLLFIAAAFVVIYDLWPKHHATRLGIAAAFLLPLIATASSAGAAGDVVRSGMTTVNEATGGVIGTAFDDKQAFTRDDEANTRKSHAPSTTTPSTGTRPPARPPVVTPTTSTHG